MSTKKVTVAKVKEQSAEDLRREIQETKGLLDYYRDVQEDARVDDNPIEITACSAKIRYLNKKLKYLQDVLKVVTKS